jgi:nucleoside-diphosphate-sugar epimerase
VTELVTGATGLVGSHVAERLVESGRRVRGLVRRGSDVDHLRRLGVELAFGDLRDPASLDAALEGVSAVYHNAALVGDWGPRAHFLEVGVWGTERLAALAGRRGVERFVHMSSASVYGLARLQGHRVDEGAPLVRGPGLLDSYSFAKATAERVLWALQAAGRLAITVLRPTFVYGPRDRLVLPRVTRLLREGRLRVMGSGRNRVPLIHAADVADAALRAGTLPVAAGRAYNLDGPRDLTQREALETLADLAGAVPPRMTVPLPIAYGRAALAEAWGRLARRPRPPRVTRYVVAALAGDVLFDTSRARGELLWEPRVPTLEGLKLALDALRTPGAGRLT